ncbi:MAG: hypothetical protein NZM29_05315 [Nitrospira sp.]|nr:hypothetical protein [Nitrospira sp.]
MNRQCLLDVQPNYWTDLEADHERVIGLHKDWRVIDERAFDYL